jgi:hypothetical protein
MKRSVRVVTVTEANTRGLGHEKPYNGDFKEFSAVQPPSFPLGKKELDKLISKDPSGLLAPDLHCFQNC